MILFESGQIVGIYEIMRGVYLLGFSFCLFFFPQIYECRGRRGIWSERVV